MFTIADPEPSAVAFEVADDEPGAFGELARVQVQPIGAAAGAGQAEGTVHVEPYPRNLVTSGRTLDARVELDQPLSGARYGMRARLTPASPGP